MTEPPVPVRESLVLLKKAQAGDRQALNSLLDRYFERVLRIVRARMGPRLRAREDSMDIAQNAMIRILDSLENFEPRSEGSFLQWVSRLVENEIRDQLDFHGAQKRRISREVPLAPQGERPGLETQLPDPSQKSPSQEVALREEVRRLEEGLDRLGEKKEVIVLRDLAGLTFKEIGKELHLSEDAARMQYVRAVDQLTDLLAEPEGP